VDPDTAASLRELLLHQAVAALATLHRGEPAVSMVPFVLVPAEAQLLLHVSALATHTRDMLEHPRVGLLVRAEVTAGAIVQALPRVSLQADAEPTFELADFSLVVLQPRSARLVAGFGRAHSLVGERLLDWLRGRG
jgi:putative heme iron utilization protein